MSTIIFYSDLDHPRINYVISVLNFHFAPHKILLKTFAGELNKPNSPCIFYTNQNPHYGLWIKNHNTISNDNVLSKPIVHQYKGLHVLFPTFENDDFPFDLPSAVFWMLSRWEEYSNQNRDIHNRFPATASVAYQQGFLEHPVVDQWIYYLRKKLSNLYPELVFTKPKAKKIRTVDVDFAWRYKHKSYPFAVKSILRDFWTGHPDLGLNGLKVLVGLARDPYDLYDLLAQKKCILFFPLGEKGQYDKNHSRYNPKYQHIIKNWIINYTGGLHPSYVAVNDLKVLEDEVLVFNKITNSKPVRSRQHFLRLIFPKTYRNLIKCGILEDWTMGYADSPGFRAGTAYPFHWYDIEKEQETNLTIYPTIVMDVTLRHYLGLTIAEAKEKIQDIWAKMQPTGGYFITLWHNNSISGYDPEWRNWDKLFDLEGEEHLNPEL